jgi:branched-chain amino acid transport system ATP-binding protein/branched-chain amino acid transport system permease protein
MGNPYTLRVLTLSGVYALLVIGYQFIFGYAGALSLAQGTFFGLGAYVTGILGSQLGWSFPATFSLAVAAAGALSLLVAAPVLRLESHYFALATLGIGQVVLLAAVNWQGLTGGANGIPGVPGIVVFGQPVPRGLPMLLFVWSFAGLGALVAWQIMRGLYGRAFQVMRENAIAALSIGIDVGRLRLVAFTFSALYGGAAGALYVHTIGVISPEVLEFPIMVACLTMAVVGGRARVAGAVVGAVLLVHLPEWLRFLEKSYLIAYGAALLIAIIGAPSGLVGALERLLPERPPAGPAPLPLAPRRRPAEGASPLLEVEGASIAFGGIKAVDEVGFAVARGEVVGLIGPNGSGKTTLVNLITGLYRPERGRIRLSGRDITAEPPFRIARLGIARSFQNVNLAEGMSALDNVAVARAGTEGAGLAAALLAGNVDRALTRARGQAMALLDALGIAAVAARPCGTLPHGLRRRVEIARALALEPRLLILDEPAAGLNEAEQAELARRLSALAEDGLTLLVIEHNMPFMMRLARRIICLDDGRIVATGSPQEIQRDPRVVEAYLGLPRVPPP